MKQSTNFYSLEKIWTKTTLHSWRCEGNYSCVNISWKKILLNEKIVEHLKYSTDFRLNQGKIEKKITRLNECFIDFITSRGRDAAETKLCNILYKKLFEAAKEK